MKKNLFYYEFMDDRPIWFIVAENETEAEYYLKVLLGINDDFIVFTWIGEFEIEGPDNAAFCDQHYVFHEKYRPFIPSIPMLLKLPGFERVGRRQIMYNVMKIVITINKSIIRKQNENIASAKRDDC